MCSPAAFIAMTVVGTGVSAYGQYQQGEYQSKVAQNNAFVQRQLAQRALQRGEREEQRHRMQVAKVKGDQRAAFGASGRDISGSASDILVDTAEMGELDALMIRSNAADDAYAYEVGAVNSRAQGKLARRRGVYGAAGTLLSGGGRVGSQWYNYKQG